MDTLRKNSTNAIRILTAVLIAKVTIGVVLRYGEYLPPDFQSDFLVGRSGYFFGSYSVSFYVHIVTGPITLLAGLALMSQWFLRRFPQWHSRLGKLQVVCVLATSASGLWMAQHAATGAIAGIGFATLAVVTAASVLLGWRTAVQRRFVEHRRWMMRCFILLCSAVVLRLTAGLATVTAFDADWVYPLSAWACWLVPLFAYEIARSKFLRSVCVRLAHGVPNRRIKRSQAS